MSTGEVNYKIKADASGMTAELGKAERSVEGVNKAQKNATKSAQNLGKQSSSVDKLKKSFVGLGSAIAGLGVGLAFRKMVANTAKQDAALAQLNTTLESTEFAAGKTADELTRTAAELQKVTKFGDEAIIEMQALLLTFKDIKGDNFDRTTQAVLDMATAMRTDLKSASIQLGKALNDPARNLSALTRSGIQFTESQTEMIKQMQASGDMAGAQAIILKELESQFGGSAEAARDTLGGALAGLSNAFNDLFEAEQNTSGAMINSINALEKSITSSTFKAAIDLVIESLSTIFDWITKIYEGWYVLGRGLANGFAKLREVTGWFADDLDRLGEELTKTVKPAEMLREVTVQSTRHTREMVVAVDDERESLDQLQEVVVTATKKEYELADAVTASTVATQEATAAQDPYQEALQGTVERIDTVFADAWRNIGDGAGDLFDNLIDGFKTTLAEMAHIALTRPIIMQIGAAFGVGSASSAASAAGGLGGIASAGSSLLSGGRALMAGGLGSLAGGYQWAGQQLGGLGLHGAAGSAYNAAGQYTGGLGSSLGNLGLNMGAGFAGNYLGGKVYGDTSGVGSALGGAVGSIWGPLGTGAGAFLGGAAERVLGNVFGFGGKGGNNAGASDFNLATGLNNAAGIGKNFDQSNVDAAGGLVGAMQAFADIVGGSSLSGRIKVGNTSGIKLNGTRYDSAEELLDATFDQILAGATSLDDGLKELIRGFEGTAEQTLQFSAAVMSLDEASGINSVTQAIKDFNAEQPTVMRAWQDQTGVIKTLIQNFDGSAFAAEELNGALLANKVAAYEMALAIQAMGEQISSIASDQAATIRESVMSSEELRASRLAERNALRGDLGSMTDPEKIAAAGTRILELNQLIFDSLGEAAQQGRADSFATFAENTAEHVQRRLDVSVENMQSAQEDINQRITKMLQDGAAAQQKAADTQLTAAEIMLQAAQLSGGGLTAELV